MIGNFLKSGAWICWVLFGVTACYGEKLISGWDFDPDPDPFDESSLLDLRYLNEDQAGETGWVNLDGQGGFQLGNGEPVRFWAVNTGVLRRVPYRQRKGLGWRDPEDIDRHARWLAKRGVNMVRLHAFIEPSDPASDDLDSPNREEIEWIWRTVAAMKKAGIYTTVSPYWAHHMKSEDAAWGTDWEGRHGGLLFFDETMQASYKQWLRVLFKTPSEELGGKTLAEEPALAIFQIQNEDSFLWWTGTDFADGPRARLEKKFFQWTQRKYGDVRTAIEAWGEDPRGELPAASERIPLAKTFELTRSGKSSQTQSKRLEDQTQFYVETMVSFNLELARFLREELGCPVLVNSGNWKTADVVYLEDLERYSNSHTDVVAVNRYFSGLHQGDKRGWAIEAGDRFTSPSVLKEHSLSLPLALKQVEGKPMIITESAWVQPMDTSLESPLLVSAYSSLTGVDIYYWFNVMTEGFEPPRSANGFDLSTQAKWVTMVPEVSGQWSAAALIYRKGFLDTGKPVVQEHRSLKGMWQRLSPVIAESSSYDPNRDSGNLAPNSSLAKGIDPWAFFVGPVSLRFDSSEKWTRVLEGLDTYIDKSEDGVVVTSVTGQLKLDTVNERFSFDSPQAQGVIHYRTGKTKLSSVSFENAGPPVSASVVALDGRAIEHSKEVLLQVATQSRPSGWTEVDVRFEVDGKETEGKEILNIGSAPWRVETADLRISLNNTSLSLCYVLDANGMVVDEIPLERRNGMVSVSFPPGTLYVVLK
ncbi:beta-galactosidase [Pelagicoccus albus]|uniref:Beta-galactosidase n=1 Tax=Pelagicoccus albus TaxID=415222 RepID=A0A7X1EAS6_9BACT|nr:beta-galactosidase [Pelagicoccus albus]MBC2607072.1 beta-galactosidase [Pelagicoccus albus]